MRNFDYGNTRLRAMKARLLTYPELVTLSSAGSVSRLLNALTITAYRTAVEAALVQHEGLTCLHIALQRDLLRLGRKIRGFFSGKAETLVRLTLEKHDVENIKTVLRGLTHQLPAKEILESLLPLGDLQPTDLTALAAAKDRRTAIDLLATWRSPLAQPLLAQPAGQRRLPHLERTLDQWYFTRVMNTAVCQNTTLSQNLQLETDIANIMTALRLVGVADLETMLQQHLGVSDMTILFIGPGRIPLRRLVETAVQPTLPDAIDCLADTPFAPILTSALVRYQAVERLSVFEKALIHHKIQTARTLFIRDPLGIGVLVGYLTLKTVEISNLRLIGQGLSFGDAPEQIQERLIT